MFDNKQRYKPKHLLEGRIKMKKMQKIMSLLLALMLVFSMAACGSSDEGASSPTDVPTPPADTSAPVESEQPEEPAVEDDGINLAIVYEQDDSMINNYSIIAVNPEAPFVDADGNAVADVAVNSVGAAALVNWIISDACKELASNYGFEEYGEYLFYWKDNAPTTTAEIPAATEETKLIRLSTTTSVNDSGLLGYLLPIFESEYGYTVEVYSAGTGKSIANAKAGNADVILVHSKSQEEAFIADGFAAVVEGQSAERLTFMYNYYVLIGPKDDPAGCAAAPSVVDAFQLIADGEYTFISRGDGSGTHTKEISLWNADLGITKEADSIADYSWYNFSNAGMGVCLTMANEMGGYILSDKATFLTFRANRGVM